MCTKLVPSLVLILFLLSPLHFYHFSQPKGEFGVVHKAHLMQWKNSAAQIVAVKTMKGACVCIHELHVQEWQASCCLLLFAGLFSTRDLYSMVEEIMIMQAFNHPNVMALVGVSFDMNQVPSMVMPLMANGSLLSYLKRDRVRLLLPADTSEETVCHFHFHSFTTSF